MVIDAVIEFVRPLLDGFVANPGQLGLAVALLASVLYYRKVTSAASMLGSVMGKLVFSAAIVGVLLLAGVITGIDVQQTVEYLHVVGEWAWQAIERAEAVQR